MATRDELLSAPRSGARPLRGSDPGHGISQSSSRLSAGESRDREPEPEPSRREPEPEPARGGSSRPKPSIASRSSSSIAKGVTRPVQTARRGIGEGGQHLLAAELLIFITIVAIRAVAQYGPGDKKSLPADQFGPLFILGNGLAAFFFLSFLTVRQSRTAKIALGFGALIDLVLLMKSIPHIDSLAAEYAAPRKYVPVNESGTFALQEAAVPPVLPADLQQEVQDRKLPPQPKGESARKSMSYARSALPHFGLSTADWNDLVKLWNQESGWSPVATNPSSGAYGIAQALPPTKYPKDAQASGGSNPYDQINWGLQYIKQRYGSIARAWAHEQHFGWY